MGHLQVSSVIVRIVAYSPFDIRLASIGGGGGGALTAAAGRGARGTMVLGADAVALGVVILRFDGRDGVARPDRPSRWTFPMTAFRVTPPNCVAI